MSPTRVPLVLGTGTFGKPNTLSARVYDIPTSQRIIDIFTLEQGHTYIDTARIYGDGDAEQFLSGCDLHNDGKVVIDTKVHPAIGGAGNLTAENIRRSLFESIKALGGKKIRIFYLHYPDHKTPLEETADGINILYKEGHFEEFGLSNFAAFEVAEMWTICKERGYVLPTVYQGAYNLIQRGAEVELFHALRKYNIRFAAYSPLAGGILSGNIKGKDIPLEKGSRYDPDTAAGQIVRRMFLSGTELEAYQYLEVYLKSHHPSLTPAEVALRWLQHHSPLGPNDTVIIGASKPSHVVDNCVDSAKGPLPDDLIQVIETTWLMAKARAQAYFMPD